MTKGITLLTFAVLLLASCSKSTPQSSSNTSGVATTAPEVVSFPIQNTKFKNCTFKNPNPTYTINSPITPNPIDCQEGVAKSVQLLSTATLPLGLSFSLQTLSLVGTPTEKVTNAPYDFYIENEAGYLVLRLRLTVK